MLGTHCSINELKLICLIFEVAGVDSDLRIIQPDDVRHPYPPLSDFSTFSPPQATDSNSMEQSPDISLTEDSPALSSSNPELRHDSRFSTEPYIRTVYHPSSHKADTFELLSATSRFSSPPKLATRPAEPPYAPFKSFADFSFTSYVMKTRLSQPEVTELLKIHNRKEWYTGDSKISFTNVKQIVKTLDSAAVKYGNVSIAPD